MVDNKISKMASVYGNLIVKGEKVIGDVPGVIREDVKQWLVDNGYPELTGQIWLCF